LLVSATDLIVTRRARLPLPMIVILARMRYVSFTAWVAIGPQPDAAVGPANHGAAKGQLRAEVGCRHGRGAAEDATHVKVVARDGDGGGANSANMSGLSSRATAERFRIDGLMA
jgi:hypothetical protein